MIAVKNKMSAIIAKIAFGVGRGAYNKAHRYRIYGL